MFEMCSPLGRSCKSACQQPGLNAALNTCTTPYEREFKSRSQLTVMQTLSSQVHQGALSCATEAGAAIPEHAEHP